MANIKIRYEYLYELEQIFSDKKIYWDKLINSDKVNLRYWQRKYNTPMGKLLRRSGFKFYRASLAEKYYKQFKEIFPNFIIENNISVKDISLYQVYMEHCRKNKIDHIKNLINWGFKYKKKEVATMKDIILAKLVLWIACRDLQGYDDIFESRSDITVDDLHDLQDWAEMGEHDFLVDWLGKHNSAEIKDLIIEAWLK